MIEILEKGGLAMVPIVLCAFIGIAIFIERAVFFFLTETDYNIFRDSLVDKIKKNNIHSKNLFLEYEPDKAASKLTLLKGWLKCKKWNSSPYLKISTAYIDNIKAGHKSREETLKRVGSEEIEKMERYFQGLSAISHASPLLGLLGTVTGIIGAFSVIAELGGQVDVTALAGGIWEAMLTTAAGLSVAIPTHLAFLYFEKIVNERANRMSYIITYLNETVYSENNSAQSPDEPSGGSELISHSKSNEEVLGDEVG